uniref:Dolichyl-diphosphooligosaccharide--protein glycosyltransferase subunit 2 n=1 Tax=Ascaris suum TaxID=6253 RepID=F1KX96_ASCSU
MAITIYMIILISLIRSAYFATPFLNHYLDSASRESLINVFQNALNTKELSSLHHGVSGLKALDIQIDAAKSQVICDAAKKASGTSLSAIYDAASIASELKGCNLGTITGAKETIEAASKQEKPTTSDLFYALSAAHILNLKVNYVDFTKALTTAFKDDSASSLAHGLNAAALLDKANAEKFLNRIEDIVGQADDVDGKYLQLEGGLSVTAMGVYGIYALADKVNKSPNVKSDEAVKLANYLVSRRGVQMDRGAYLLVKALKKLAFNNFQVPVVISLASNMAIMDASQPIQIRVSNVLGESVGELSVNIDSATHVATKEVVATRQPLMRVAADPKHTLYEAKIDKAKARGFYVIALTAGSHDKRLVGTNGASVMVKILAKMRIEDVTVAVFDRELSKSTDTHKVKESSKLGRVLEADVHSKMEIKFTVREAKSGDAVTVHQAFVAFVHVDTKHEIIFIATPDRKNLYTFDVDFEKATKDFEGLSGKYAVRLIIGDAAIANAFDWNLVDVNLKLPAMVPPKVKKSEEVNYEKLPEIKHMFREPEKRPSQIVSDAFTVLCILPLLVLLILWLRVGINFGNMPLSLWTLAFHASLAGIFGLYFIFWLRLNMFQTLKYLSAIGALTFMAGNRLLRAVAQKRKEKSE